MMKRPFLGVILTLFSLSFSSALANPTFDEAPVREKIQTPLGARVMASRAANAARYAQAQAVIQAYNVKRKIGRNPQEPHPDYFAYLEEYQNYQRDEQCNYISDHINATVSNDCQLVAAPEACEMVMRDTENQISEAQSRFNKLRKESRQDKANGTQLLKAYRGALITQINSYKNQLQQCRSLLEPVYSQTCMESYSRAIPDHVVEQVATQCTEGAVVSAVDDYVNWMNAGTSENVVRAKYQYGVARNNAIQLAEILFTINNFIQVLEGDLSEGRVRLPASSPRPVARPER